MNRRAFLALVAGLVLAGRKTEVLLEINTLDIAQLTYGSPPKRLTVCYPKNALDAQGQLLNSYQGLVFLHGGGWSGGDRNSHIDLIRALAREGLVVASLDYTLAVPAEEPALPKVMADITAGIAKILTFSCVAGQPVSLCGCSAGGHLALLYALTQQHSLHSVVALSACYDLEPIEAAFQQQSDLRLDYLLGAGYTPAQRDAASPALLSLTGYNTPTLLLQGELDPFLPLGFEASGFFAALQAASIPSSLFRLQEGEHDLAGAHSKAAGFIYSGVVT